MGQIALQEWIDSYILFFFLMFLAVIAWFLWDDLTNKG